MTRFAIYLNLTEPLGTDAPSVKARIRERIRREGGTITKVHRNAVPESGTYRFLRVHYTTKDEQ